MILDYLEGCLRRPNTTAVAEIVEHPSRTTRRALEDLTAHRVVQRLPGGDGKADFWELTPRARRWLDGMTLPVSSVSLDTPLKEIKITNDDKTGKVGQASLPAEL